MKLTKNYCPVPSFVLKQFLKKLLKLSGKIRKWKLLNINFLLKRKSPTKHVKLLDIFDSICARTDKIWWVSVLFRVFQRWLIKATIFWLDIGWFSWHFLRWFDIELQNDFDFSFLNWNKRYQIWKIIHDISCHRSLFLCVLTY